MLKPVAPIVCVRLLTNMRLSIAACWLVFCVGCTPGGTNSFDMNTVLVGDLKPEGEQVISQGNEFSFEKYFTLVDEISLSDEVVIGTINQLSVGPEGEFLIVDLTANRVLLFNPDGSFGKILDPETCHPGFDWLPKQAGYDSVGNILVLNRSMGGFSFDGKGNCLNIFGREYPIPRFAANFGTGEIIGMKVSGSEYQIQKTEGRGSQFDVILRGKAPILMGRLAAGHITVGHNGLIYFVLPFSPFVFRMGADDGTISILGYKPSYYRAITEDITEAENSAPKTFIPAINKLVNNNSITSRIFALDTDKFLIVYMNPFYLKPEDESKRFGIHVLDGNGMSLLSEEILIGDNVFVAAGHGRAYSVSPPDLDGSHSPLNSSIAIYQFNN